ncbi:glucosamine-6-phosphate deaminase [Microbacterium oleivorans]|uniref:Glucosamine-6-phosphate deaminase n=1 Tax=Microbacterium oleivorans TaxID=273677 RepID=A0A031FSP5_9MICO|nr:glucosamine-6-phosphate deaminase [Microbacterium oleivorans]EZP27879.1 Glucosamine-6-phosphate deaminase [Microbacterium oleivorans]
MRILLSPDAAGAGEIAATLVAASLRDLPAPVLGVATGSSPQPLYRALAARVHAGLDLSRTTAFALDEYVGLPVDHPESYHAVIAREVTAPLGLDAERVHVPEGAAADPVAAAARYEAAIVAAGGVDLQILGIGANGHIGFNEPGSDADSRTRIVELAPRTVADNSRFFDGDAGRVPTHALTQGIGTILAAREIVLVAWGESKADAVARAVEGPQTAELPASFLQRHARVTLVLDHAAASKLSPNSLPVEVAR